MTGSISNISDAYQGIAPGSIVRAVKVAAEKTGVDFAFLMNKAATESSFNPTAKSKTSSATGLFQFIESTWLKMVKDHGAKYGLGPYADQIEMKDGKACVTDGRTKEAILNLRKNPEISALMAGEFSAGNRDYLEKRTDCAIGTTELYLAHFLGAGGAAKFINARATDGAQCAARLFPREAQANKNVFFDSTTGRARSLDDIHALLSRKFSCDGGASPARPSPSPAPAQRSTPSSPLPIELARAHLVSIGGAADGIVWFDAPKKNLGGFSAGAGSLALQPLSADAVLMLSQMQQAETEGKNKRPDYNS